MSMKTFAALAVCAAGLAACATPAPAPQAAAGAEAPVICRERLNYYSNTVSTVCGTAAQWAELEEAEARLMKRTVERFQGSAYTD